MKKPEKFTREWFAEKGRQGGNKTKKLYGSEHYAKIGGKKVRNSKKLSKIPIKQPI